MTVYVPPAGSIPTLPVPSLGGVASVHLIGIGGAGMRNLARLFLAMGVSVSGSDLKDSRGVEELKALGARVWVGHDPARIGEPDAVVISSAIRDTNPELAEARGRELPVWARQQALAALAAGRRSIAVAGTHGKTTTTSLLSVVLERAGTDPSYVVGGDLNESGSGARSGSGDLFVFEADESDGSFLLARPFVGIITNVEVDHVDFYPGGGPEIEAAFAAFARRCDHARGVRRRRGSASSSVDSRVPGVHLRTWAPQRSRRVRRPLGPEPVRVAASGWQPARSSR